MEELFENIKEQVTLLSLKEEYNGLKHDLEKTKSGDISGIFSHEQDEEVRRISILLNAFEHIVEWYGGSRALKELQ